MRGTINNSFFPFDIVIILSDSLWEDVKDRQQGFYARMFSQYVPVAFVQKKDTTENIPPIVNDNNINVYSCVFGYSSDTLAYVIKKSKVNKDFPRIFFWLYTSEFLSYIKNLTCKYNIGVHLINSTYEIPVLKQLQNNTTFILTNSEEISSKINRSEEISSVAYTISNNIDYSSCDDSLYEKCFLEIVDLIKQRGIYFNNSHLKEYKKKVLLLYSVASCRVNTIREHVNAYGLFSRHEVTFFDATNHNKIHECFLNSFDAVVVHFSVRISVRGHLSEDIYQKLKKYQGVKVLFIQDEYDNLRMTYSYMESIGFDSVFTCVPDQYVEYVYPSIKFPDTRFINNFTGYTSYALFNYNSPPIASRKTDVFYRGRDLPYIYGTLGMEKYEIGFKFKDALKEQKIELITDIESDESKRIYGDAWYYTLSHSKATLATESGSNVFDFEGNLQELIDEDLKSGKDYEYIYQKYIKDREEHIRMNQISPKLFEAISLKTVLILYEGNYSGVLEPNKHYIPLKKDFSNIIDVVSILKDNERLQEIADKAYQDIILSDKYSYQSFIRYLFDIEIDRQVLFWNRQNMERCSSKKKNWIQKLDHYTIYRSEISKLQSYAASSNIRSEDYELYYLENNATINWRLNDLKMFITKRCYQLGKGSYHLSRQTIFFIRRILYAILRRFFKESN